MKTTQQNTSMLLVAASLAACAHSTPVTPAPLAAEEAGQLRAAIVGTCDVTATQKEGSKAEDASGLTLTFMGDGKAAYLASTPFGAVRSDYGYRLDGRNIITDGPLETLRADDFSGPTLKLFNYAMSQTYFCTKRS